MKTESTVMYVLRLALTLFVITAVVAAALAGVNSITKPAIEKLTAEKTQQAIELVLPGGGEEIEAPVMDLVSKVYKGENGYAVEATPGAVKEIERKRANEEKLERERRAAAETLAKQLKDKLITLKVKCGGQGRLYGRITSAEIAAALKEQHAVEIDKRKIECEDIRQVGEYAVSVTLYTGVKTPMKVKVDSL